MVRGGLAPTSPPLAPPLPPQFSVGAERGPRVAPEAVVFGMFVFLYLIAMIVLHR